jgi:hypothetical protein
MVSIDSSTPAFAGGSNDPWTSASFTPPNDSLLLVVVVGDWFGSTPTLTPTSTGLTFTSVFRTGSINNGVIEFFTAPVGSNGGSSRTVSVTTSLSSDVGGMKVFVLTDYYAADPIEVTGSGGPTSTNSITPTVVTTITDGCWVFGGAVNWVGGSISTTSTDNFEEFNDNDLSVAVVWKSAATATAGPVTLNWDAEGTGNSQVWNWGAVAVRPSTYVPPPITVVSAGAAVSGTTSITTAAYGAGWQAGDLIVYTVASGQTSENTPTISGFTDRGSLSGGGGTFGGGEGPRRLTFFTREAQGGDDTTPTISLASGSVMIAASTVLRASAGYTWDTPVSAFGAEITQGTSWTQAMTSDPGIAADDLLLLACAVRDTSNSTVEGVTATGLVVGTVTERTDSSSETGNDVALHVSTVPVLAPNSATPTRTATHSTSETGVMGLLRIRAVSGNATATPTGITTAATIGAPTIQAQADATATPTGITTAATVGTPAVRIFRYIAGVAGTGTGQYFVDAAGDPILVRGYVLWGLMTNAGRWNGGDWEADLEGAVAKLESMGVNVLYTDPLGNTQNGGAFNNGNYHDGTAPFTSTSPVTFNNTFWARTDYLFDLCEAAGITVFLNWAYQDDLDNAALSSFNTTQLGQYGTALGNRYKNRPNLVWMMGGDYFDTFNTQVTAVRNAIEATGDTHLQGIQNYPETTSRRDLESGSSLTTGTNHTDFNFVYTYNATYWGMEIAYAESSPLPVMWGDGHFDQDTTADRKLMRNLTWWVFSYGARGIIHGSEATWTWGSGALANLDDETYSSVDMPQIWDTFTSLENWYLLVPDTDSSFVTAGRGTKSDYVTSSGGGGGEYNSSDTASTYITAGVTADGTLAVVYFPADTTITVDDSELAAGYTVRWVDPVNGSSTPETPNSTYSPTGTNSVGGADWLLVFEAEADPDVLVEPSSVAGASSIGSPTVRISSTVATATVSATAAVGAPTVRLGAAVTASVVPATATLGSPTVRGAATATPAAVAGTATVGTPSVTASSNATATPSVVAGTAAVGAPSVQTGNSVTATPASVDAEASVGTPALSTSEIAAPSNVAGVATISAPSVSAGANATVSATTVAAAASVGAPTVSAGSGVSAATVAGSASITTPTASTGATATPSPVAGATTVAAPGVSAGGSATASPTAVEATASVPTPSLTTSSRVAASQVAAVASIPAPAVVSGSGATAAPSGITRSVTISVPTIRLGAVITPTGVGAGTDMPAPTLHTSVLVPAFTVSAVATIPPPVPVSVTPGSAKAAVGVRPTSHGAYGPAAAAGAGDEFGVASSGGTGSVPRATGGV